MGLVRQFLGIDGGDVLKNGIHLPKQFTYHSVTHSFPPPEQAESLSPGQGPLPLPQDTRKNRMLPDTGTFYYSTLSMAMQYLL